MNFKPLKTLTLLSLFIYAAPAKAQLLKKMQKTVEEKASKKLADAMNGKKSIGINDQKTEESTSNDTPMEEVYSFSPGSEIIFESDFKRDPKGLMPKKWKSSGSGGVAAITNIPGNWLALTEKSTYKIDSLFTTPGNFTVEFDLMSRSEEAADIGSMSFGFARDNSTKNHLTDAYNGNAITNTQLHFHNKEITNASSDTKIYSTVKYPFANYANALMHIAIAVEGENMRVYINKSKVLDTKMFKPEAQKFLYITAPFSYDQNAKVYLGNFLMAKN